MAKNVTATPNVRSGSEAQNLITDAKQNPSPEWIAALRETFPTERAVDATLTAKMQRRSGPRHTAQPVAQVAERLQAFLEKRLEQNFSISNIRSLAGGSSKEQFAFDLTVAGEVQVYVLRMRPAESIVETHSLREFQAMRAVRHVLPVPAVHWCDPDGAELGQPALIASFCEGVTKPPADGAYTPRQGFGAKYRDILAPQFVDYFARLGKFDWRSADVSAFDPPPADSNAGVISAINWWQRVWEEDSLEAYPLMTLAAHWLRAHAPKIDHVSFVHQDFRGGNFLFRPEDGRITAILDWELVQLGDRHQDLAFFLAPLFSEKDESGAELVGGLLPREEFLREYERLSGLPIDPARLDYYHIFGCWRGIINGLATAPRIAMGEKTHQDIRVGWITNSAPLLLAALHDALSGRV